MKKLLASMGAVIALVAALIAGSAATAPPAQALSGSEFDPANIISDENFYDTAAMTQAQVQSFLTSRVSCQTSLCLAVGRFASTTQAPNAMCTGYDGVAGGEPASQIIYRVQIACGISARVLLVMLQKEQGLITNPAPTESRLRIAMGYACPDTAACDTTYYGFFNQVYNAAKQLKRYGNPPGTSNYFTWFKIGSPSAVQLHPNAACGAPVITIRNKATAALYYYTPYQPNAAALANLSGTGDACSSYGNRNFWVYYNTWFGSSTSQGPLLVAQKYAAFGGASGALGAPISDVIVISQNGGGLGQAFANGSIYWTKSGGAYAVLAGPVLTYYFGQGGAAGALGWPLSDTAALTAAGSTGSQQAFTAGAVYSSAAGTFLVAGATRTAYFARNGALGDLGWPTSAQSCTLAQGGCIQRFTGGAIYTTPAGLGIAVVGAIDPAYTAAGGPTSWGYPISNPIPMTSAGGGLGQAFSAGSAYAPAGGSAYFVSGAIRDYYFSRGGADGVLGWPAGAQTCSADQTSCSQRFTGGTVAWTKAGGAAVTSPEIDAAYAALGGASGALGAATSGLIWIPQNGGGLGKAYAGGSIYWSTATGAFAVTGGTRDRYFAVGGSAGALGWPTANAVCGLPNNGCSQTFQNGAIAGRASSGFYAVTPAYLTAVNAAGGMGGALGLPTTGLLNVAGNGGGTGQVFDGGSLYSSAAGTFPVSGGIRDYYFSYGGAAGAIGWPAAAQACTGATCTQKFTGGTVTWSAATGGTLTR